MTDTVHKHILKPYTTLELPKGYEILTVNEQRGNICMWVKVVEGNTETRKVKFRVYGTGHPMDDMNHVYHGSAFLDSGALVFHVFEVN